YPVARRVRPGIVLQIACRIVEHDVAATAADAAAKRGRPSVAAIEPGPWGNEPPARVTGHVDATHDGAALGRNGAGTLSNQVQERAPRHRSAHCRDAARRRLG